MKWLISLLFGFPLLATEHVNFFNIHVDHQDNLLAITTEPEPLLAYSVLKDDEYSIDKGTYDLMLDSPMRQVAFLMRTLERNRGTIHKKTDEPLPIISFKFELAVREVTGQVVEEIQYKVIVGLAQETGKGFISCDQVADRFEFSIEDLTEKEEYSSYLNHLVFPFNERKMRKPGADEFLVDLYYQWPDVEVDKGDFSVIDLFPSLILWNKGPIRKLKIHLGTTYCFKNENGWQQVRSEHLRAFSRSIDAYSEVLSHIEAGDKEASVAALEDYITLVPADKKALKKLMDYYLETGKNEEALDLITRFQPFFATIREGLPNQRSLEARAERTRNLLLGKRASFTRDDRVLLEITSPVDGDLVTGTTDLYFALSGNEAPILQIECYLNDQLIAKLDGPPFQTPFTVDGMTGKAELRVVSYFENETYQQDKIGIQTLRVDAEQRVDLVALRASVFQVKSGLDRELTLEDFEIRENGKVKKIEHFRKDTAPLRVAILLDTSISMFGEKLYRAQFAVKTFLSKLEPDDRVSIYSFDDKVMKLSDFTNDYRGVTPQLMTLSPQASTSLYDGMLIAHDALLGQNGTKIMIVISDGDDSVSATTDLHVAKILRHSPVMVYSVVLPGGFLGQPDRGSEFLEAMADLSGSISTRVRSVGNLDETFERIYQDLKSLYYMDYYTDLVDAERRKLKVKLKASGARVRIRTLN